MKSKKNTIPSYWTSGINHLMSVDHVLSSVIKKHKNTSYLKCTNTLFKTFFSIIVGQQISIEAANSIEKRIKSQIKSISPKNILNTNDNNLRLMGLSFRKVQYIKGVASLILKNRNFFASLSKMNDVDAIAELSTLYGIGPWSAEMFLIFQYNRQNILPLGDIGLINSFCNNYNVDKKDFLKIIPKYKKIWEPYCTVATWYLWRDIDEDTVQY
jgi:DNA-3-methyladenine glycosylase II